MDAIYPSAKQAFLSSAINWLSDPVICVLISTGNYTYSSAHASLADVPMAARIAASGTLANRTALLGVADADDVTFGTTFGNVINAVILCSNTGTDISSPLIAYLDQALSGLPLNPNGNPITVVWSNGSAGIFAL